MNKTYLSLAKNLVIFVAVVTAVGCASDAYAKSENSNSGKHDVVVGKVDEVKGNQLTIEEKGKKVESFLNGAPIISQNKGKGKAASVIKKNDKVAIISSESGEASRGGKVKKVVKVFVKEASAGAQSKRQAVQGVIVEASGSSLLLAHQIHRDRTYRITTDSLTEIKVKGVQTVGLSSLQVGQRVVVVGDLQPGGGLLARRIHVIPGLAKGIFKKQPIASSSASPVASASASPVASASATPEASATPLPTP